MNPGLDRREGPGRPGWSRDAPGRTAAQAEVHARPIEPAGAPARLRRVAFLFGGEPEAARVALEAFASWAREAGIPPPGESDRRIRFAAAERAVVWEFHTEFVTLTWSGAPKDQVAWPDGIGLEAYSHLPVIVASRVDLEDLPEITPLALAGFDPLSLCYSQIENGVAEVATDFRVDADGFTRYEFAAGQLGPIRRGILVRRLLEIETYRVMALQGLPLARAASGDIAEVELRLARLLEAVSDAGTAADNHAALDELQRMSVRFGRIREQTRFRLAATKAYGALLSQRLGRLSEIPTHEYNTLARYLAHRVEPALATCAAVETRQGALAEALAQTTALLNTRIGVDLQSQNRALLKTISETAHSQYRLQTTVEGLSTIAITYYALGILSYMLHGAEDRLGFDKSLVVAALAPVVFALVWWSIHRVRKRHGG